MLEEISLEKTFLLATYIEGIVYGFLACLFGATMYVYFSASYSSVGAKRDRHTTNMIIISSVMFFLATFHLAMNAYRLLVAYVDERLSPGGPVAYIGNLRTWDHILKDTIYATQENLGCGAAIYRAWVLWNFNYWVILVPTILLLVNIAAGYVVCITYADVDPTATVFLPRLTQWIKTFYSVAVVLNITTTCLMGYRIYKIHKKSANFRIGEGRLLQILRILVESAALQLIVEIVLLALYSSGKNVQYIFLESVTPIVAITFNSITVRIKLQSASEKMKSVKSNVSNHVQTIGGTMPMKRIHVSINKEVDDDAGYGSSDTFNRDKP